MKHILSILIASLSVLTSFAQRPPAAFFDGLDNMIDNPAKAKQAFLQTVAEDSTFFGSYNFLGILLFQEKKYDSAIQLLQTSIRLNRNNLNHTKEMTFERLSRAYLCSGDFERSYHTALNALKEFPDNKYLASELKETCLWAYNTQYGGLSKDYLNQELRNEYQVNSVSQEYLVMRNTIVNNRNLEFRGQSYNAQKNIDILHCSVAKSKDSVDLVFKLGWNVLKSFADNMPDYKVVYDDKEAKIWFRLGALLSNNSKAELLKEIANLGH